MKKLIFSAVSLFLVACSQPNSQVTGTYPAQQPKPTFTPVPQVQQPTKPEFAPVSRPEAPAPEAKKDGVAEKFNLQGADDVNMDFLIVYDTSFSMKGSRKELTANSQLFINEFIKNKKINFHLAVTEVWDSSVYTAGEIVRTLADGSKMTFKKGELRPIVVNGRVNANQRYITNSTPDLKKTLASTINLELVDLISKNREPRESGAENEEIFSPMLAALSPEMAAGPNAGFRRPGAHLAILIFSDAQDSSGDGQLCVYDTNTHQPIDPKKVGDKVTAVERVNCMTSTSALAHLKKLAQLAPGSTLTVNGALARVEEWNNFTQRGGPDSVLTADSYKVDPSVYGKLSTNAPTSMYGLVDATNGMKFDLQSKSYGTELAKLGRSLIQKTIRYDVGPLKYTVDTSRASIGVKINGKIIPQDSERGWSYDPATRMVHLNKGLELGGLDEFDVVVSYFPL